MWLMRGGATPQGAARRAKLEHMLSGQLISSEPSHTLPSGKAFSC